MKLMLCLSFLKRETFICLRGKSTFKAIYDILNWKSPLTQRFFRKNIKSLGVCLRKHKKVLRSSSCTLYLEIYERSVKRSSGIVLQTYLHFFNLVNIFLPSVDVILLTSYVSRGKRMSGDVTSDLWKCQNCRLFCLP
jgi:hypothetical protein